MDDGWRNTRLLVSVTESIEMKDVTSKKCSEIWRVCSREEEIEGKGRDLNTSRNGPDFLAEK